MKTGTVYQRNLKGYRKEIDRIVYESYRQDVGKGDVTSNTLVPANHRSRARVVCEREGILAGVEECIRLLKKLGLKTKALKSDGKKIRKKAVVLEIWGKTRKLLSAERTVLNILARMSGIATEVNSLRKKVRGRVGIASTRKTVPMGLLIDKKAVQAGGGMTHRLGLYDGILIKDNHLACIGSVKKAIQKAKKKHLPVVVEVERMADLIPVAEAGPHAIMLDNMSPSEIKKAVSTLKVKKLRNKVILEASGGITSKNIQKYSETRVDVISLGYLTQSVKALSFAMDIKRP